MTLGSTASPGTGRLLILASGTTGDVRPVAALTARLKQRGYPVLMVTATRDRPLVEAAGLDLWREWHPVQADYDEGFVWLKDPHPTLAPEETACMARQFERGFRAGIATAAQLFNTGESYRAVVSSTAGLPLLILPAASNGIPYFLAGPMPYTPTRAFMIDARHPRGWLLGLDNWFKWRRALNRAAGDLIRDPRFAALRALASPDVLRVQYLRRYYESRIHHLVGVSPTVFPRPRDYRPNMHVTGYCHLPWNADWTPPDELCAFLDAGAPPLYVGFGSYAFFSRGRGRQLFQMIVNALTRTGHRAVIQTGPVSIDRDDVPDHIFLTGELPHAWLFPRCCGVLHHGGGGTFHTCLEAGKPMINYPFQADQFLWATRASELGVSPPYRTTTFELNPARLAEDMVFIRRPEVRAAARRIGEAMAQDPDGTQVQAEIIERQLGPAFAGEHVS